jgi:hypothetical protein
MESWGGFDIGHAVQTSDNTACQHLGAVTIWVGGGGNVMRVQMFKRTDNASLSKGQNGEGDFFFSHLIFPFKLLGFRG